MAYRSGSLPINSFVLNIFILASGGDMDFPTFLTFKKKF